jgi:hypothetical protein
VSRATNYRTAFPDFVLDIEVPAGFDDTSYRNDSCPSWVNARAGLHLFIDYQDPADRETDGPRFILSEFDDDGVGATIVESEDIEVIYARICEISVTQTPNQEVTC